ncbi:MAG: hypothetical protein MRK01_00295 [Candidatus Scalindua sp.]|nr:hypothetical protein [Candidatus Scalindua sp.]
MTVIGLKLDHSNLLSVKGNFVAQDKINVNQYHVHSKWIRDLSSYLGLFLVSLLIIYSLIRQKFRKLCL